MRHPTQAGIGLVRMGESGFVPQNLEDDVRGKDVYDAEGQRLGSVEDLYIDRRERTLFLSFDPCLGKCLQNSAGGVGASSSVEVAELSAAVARRRANSRF